MPPLPEREFRALPSDFIWNPYPPHRGDPFHMEYVLDRISDEGQRDALLANGFATLASVYQALARGAERAAEIISGGES